MWGKVLRRSIFLLLVTACITVNMQNTNQVTTQGPPRRTTPRPGFIKTIFQVGYEVLTLLRKAISVMFQSLGRVRVPIEMMYNGVGISNSFLTILDEQWADTRNTISKINQMLNDNFLPENAPSTTPAPVIEGTNVSTTKAPYRITRNEFTRILRRNLRGLVRLFNLELDDAMKQSRVTDREYRKNATREYSKFL